MEETEKKDLSESRAFGIAVIALVYIAAAAGGIALGVLLPFGLWLNTLLADIAATVFVFIFSVALRNASVYDAYWSVQPIVILAACLAVSGASPAGLIIFVPVCVWGVRLTVNWAYTFKGLGAQDWRYTMLKEKTGAFYPIINFIGIHMVPTLVVWGCTLPAAYAVVLKPEINAGYIIFAALVLTSCVWQGIADAQMHVFRARGSGGFIREGLWKYSRHPNYLGEISVWWAVALASLCVQPDMWYLIFGAVANTLLFIFISIPLAEGHQSRKEGYEEYKRATRALLPLYKRSYTAEPEGETE